MSFSGLATPQGRRNTILASVAVASLGVAGVLGGNALSPTHPAYAAAVSVADLPQNAPSFAPLIDRVKASVVSVKVKIAAEDAEADGDGASSPPGPDGQSSPGNPKILQAVRRRHAQWRRRAAGQASDDDGRRLRLLRFG